MTKQVIICAYTGCTREIRANTKTGRCYQHANCKLVIPLPIETIKCFCGCGKPIPKYQIRDEEIIERKYVHGHNFTKINIEVTCNNCGKTKKVQRYELKNRNNHFCNRTCFANYRRQRVSVKCGYCGSVFAIIQARAKKKTKTGKIYCSNECRNNDENTITKCSYCHSPMRVKNHRAKTRINVFCNSNCQKKWETEINVGENHPLWTGTRKHKRGKNWRKMRRQVLMRDRKTCRLCGGHNRVAVHHIIPFRFFDKPEDANTLDNLIALCIHCHGKVEPKDKDNPTNEKLKRLVKQNPDQMTLGI